MKCQAECLLHLDRLRMGGSCLAGSMPGNQDRHQLDQVDQGYLHHRYLPCLHHDQLVHAGHGYLSNQVYHCLQVDQMDLVVQEDLLHQCLLVCLEDLASQWFLGYPGYHLDLFGL